MDKLVTVIVPAWNAEKYLEASLRSVLNQSHRALRLLVIDDGSSDSTPEILARLRAEDPRLEFRSVKNGGPAAARNRALAALQEGTDYVMFLDADDLLLPDAIEYALSGAEGAEQVLFGYSIQRPDGSLRDYCEPEHGPSSTPPRCWRGCASRTTAGGRIASSSSTCWSGCSASSSCRRASTATSCTRAKVSSPGIMTRSLTYAVR